MRKLLLIVGPSGCGKDTLLRSARKYFLTDPRFQFLARYITRKPGEYEENYFVEDVGFTLLRKHKFFVSSWDAHDLKYGIPKHFLDNLKPDETGIISISREKISDFEILYHEKVSVIHVAAKPAIIEKRLRQRNRETRLQIESRLARMNVPVSGKKVIPFDNSGEIEETSRLFNRLLEYLITEKR